MSEHPDEEIVHQIGCCIERLAELEPSSPIQLGRLHSAVDELEDIANEIAAPLNAAYPSGGE